MNEDIKHMHKELFKEENFIIYPDPTPQAGNNFNNDTKQNVKNIK